MVISVENFSAARTHATFLRQGFLVEIERRRHRVRRCCASPEPGDASADSHRLAGRISIDAAREHLVHMLTQRGHQHAKRRVDRRVVSIEVGSSLLEPMAVPGPAGQSGERPLESVSSRVQSQPSTFEHAFEPLPVPDRQELGLPLHPGAHMLGEGIKAYRRVVRPASRQAVVEEHVDDDLGVAPAGSSDTRQARPVCVMAIGKSIDGALERDSGHDSGWGDSLDPAPDQVREHVSGEHLGIIG